MQLQGVHGEEVEYRSNAYIIVSMNKLVEEGIIMAIVVAIGWEPDKSLR